MSADAVILTAGPGSRGGLMVAWRSIWFPIGMSERGTPVYVPTSEPWMLASDGTAFHATDVTLKHNERRKTVDTVCGKRAHRFGVYGNEDIMLIPVWPPPARWSSARARCRKCFEATGRRRPHAMFRDLTSSR